MKLLWIAAAGYLAFAAPAGATQISAFGQTSGSNVLTATVNAADTQTTFTVSGAGANITQLLGLSPINGVFFDLFATSIDAAVPIGPAILQHYDGSFCLSTAASCSGTDILSGSFTDAAFGAGGGDGLVVQVSHPPDSLTLTSDLLSAADLAAPNSLDLGFSNVSPALHILGTTLGPFTASIAGTVSASVAVLEPGSITMLGMGLGLLALGAVARRRFEA